jgi:hypothetical protein
MQSYYTFIAMELANERAHEADRHRLAALARSADGASDRSFRRSVAVALATLSRGSAAIVRRLDECVADQLADDLGGSVAPNA